MRSIDLKDRTKKFAHRCVKLALALPKGTLGNHVRGQLIRSSTSVAANYRAACLAQSKAGFIAKLSIVIEEVDETFFWMEFVVDENLLTHKKASELIQEAKELTSILIASRKTAKSRENKKS